MGVEPGRSRLRGVSRSFRILHERNLEEYYCTLCYAMFDLKGRRVTFANSGLPYPIRYRQGKGEPIDMPGVPLGSFGASQYDEVLLDLQVVLPPATTPKARQFYADMARDLAFDPRNQGREP